VRRMTRRTGITAAAGLAVLAAGLTPVALGGGSKAPAPHSDAPTYRVTIENLTGGQALTPPLVATHRGTHVMFDVGDRASDQLAQIAENGDLGPMQALLTSNRRVAHTFTGSAPLVPAANPGGTQFTDTVTFEIDAARGRHRISWGSMLICTNDGFTGVDGLRLPKRVGQTAVALTRGYDAGSEANTEDFGDIVPPCQGLIGVSGDEGGTGESDPALATNGVIAHHPGITGREDLVPGVHGWSDPVAKFSVTRID
jgi:Spondin_N